MVLVLSVGATELTADFRRAAVVWVIVIVRLGKFITAGFCSWLGTAPVDASIISALAALTGAAVGGLTSGIANWLNHRSQVRAQWILHEKTRRQILYRDFIEEASKCYIDALQHAEADIPDLVGLYAKLSRMRVLSSKPVVHRAEDVTRKILDLSGAGQELRRTARNGRRRHDRSGTRLQRRVPRRIRGHAASTFLSFTGVIACASATRPHYPDATLARACRKPSDTPP